ncbi:hypothetical protein LPB86_10485 [Pedobacter sp. MC2016-14]|uniref:hypothetical protein n=1 Tax=Pedobacter sp. MC2016-14 TaxID=2897327 RepID=UPI001E3EE910|nr:hypothetical protein [Pedobacter sp. MC2016-14]MCD0488661.1 hypothetical protein [Pedobacter sp. MC2016-14]
MKHFRILLFVWSLVFSLAAFGQQKIDCASLLDQEPYFVTHKPKPHDSLFMRDIRILKQCGNFEGVDTVLLKGTILGTLMLDQVRGGKPATYRTLIEYINNYKKTAAYRDFIEGLMLYKRLENKQVDLKDWETDKAFFVKMGFTVNDLDDLKIYISDPLRKGLTYKEIYIGYMNEIEALGSHQ